MIKALRVDHRLVHGQVAFTWTHFLAATRIIVIDDKAAGDDFQKMALNMAKPAGVKLNVFSVEKALERAEKIDSLSDTVFITRRQQLPGLSFLSRMRISPCAAQYFTALSPRMEQSWLSWLRSPRILI